MIADLDDWRGGTLAEVRRLIREADPEAVEQWKWMGSPAWSHDGVFAVAKPLKGKVRVTFAHGSALADPNKLFNVKMGDNTWRAMDLREGDEIDAVAFEELVLEAVAYNTTQPEKPVLLSGGNPQIPKGDGDAPVQAYIAAMPGWKSDVGRRIDDLIVRAVPEVRKAVRWNSPWYGIEGEGWFLSYHVLTRYVKVTFVNGASLRPVPPGSGKVEDARWINIHEGELDEEQMAEWVRQAAALPGWHGF